MTPEQIKALLALEAKATPGPWAAIPFSGSVGIYVDEHELGVVWDDDAYADAALIVAMRNALPALLSAVSRLTAERDAMEEAIEDEAPPAEGIYQSVRDRLRLSNLRLADRDATIALQSAELSALRGALTKRIEEAYAEGWEDGYGLGWERFGDNPNSQRSLEGNITDDWSASETKAALGGGSPTEETR